MHSKRVFLLFLVLVFIGGTLLQLKKAAERPRDYYPEWYRLSRVFNDAVSHGMDHSAFVIGNSFTYTAIDPECLNLSGMRFFDFARGATPAVEIMQWLDGKGIYPHMLLVELNTAQMSDHYLADFDVILTAPDAQGFSLFKSSLEIKARYVLEAHFPLFTYALRADEFVNRLQADGLIDFFRHLFLPDPDIVHVLGAVNYRHHENGFEEDLTDYTLDQIRERTARQIGDYHGFLVSRALYSETEAQHLSNLVDTFSHHGTHVIFFRLPKHPDVIAAENELTPQLFEAATRLATKYPGSKYIDLASPQDVADFTPYLSDGNHWTAKGAALISEKLARALRSMEYEME